MWRKLRIRWLVSRQNLQAGGRLTAFGFPKSGTQVNGWACSESSLANTGSLLGEPGTVVALVSNYAQIYGTLSTLQGSAAASFALIVIDGWMLLPLLP